MDNLPREIQDLDTFNSVKVDSPFLSLFDTFQSGTGETAWSNAIRDFWLLLPDYIVIIMMKIFSFSFVLSLLLVVGIIWCSNHIIHLRKKMIADLTPDQAVASDGVGEIPSMENKKWEAVIIHINSDNMSDWKLAILECDIMLGEILERMGYTQASISEKLKSIEPSDFTNIENAWEAHKIRNQIAHEGSEFSITEREAKRVIGLYETVFREFEYI